MKAGANRHRAHTPCRSVDCTAGGPRADRACAEPENQTINTSRIVCYGLGLTGYALFDLRFNPFPTLLPYTAIGSGMPLQLAPPRPPGTDLRVSTESRRH